MADTTDSGPGTHPDAVKINDDGTPDTGGRTGWVWVEDPATGGRMDVHTSRAAWHIARGRKVVPGYPFNPGTSARPPKPAVGKDGGRLVRPSVAGPAAQFAVPAEEPPLPAAAAPPEPARRPAEEPTPPADPAGEQLAGDQDQAAGDAAADDADQPAGDATTTTTRKAGRTR